MARFPEVRIPEKPRGTPEQQIEKLYSQMWQLVEQLNNIINILNKEGNNNGTDRN